MSVESRSQAGIFNPQEAARESFDAVDKRFPEIVTPNEARLIAEKIAEGAKITDFVGVLTQKRLLALASERLKVSSADPPAPLED